MKLLSIGCGNMASAMLRAAVRSGVVKASDVTAVDPSADARADAAAAIGGGAFHPRIDDVPVQAFAQAGTIVLLGIKPQVFPDVSGAMSQVLMRATENINPLLLSIMAGTPSKVIRQAIGLDSEHPIARVMPNTPAAIGSGVCALASDTGLSAQQLEYVRSFLKPSGLVIDLPEYSIDAFTGVAGSGPAYVFAFVEALEAAGRAAGLPHAEAALSARHTVIGAAALLESRDDPPAVLRDAVTSPGGTTEAGLNALHESGFTDAVHAAVVAARDRGVELAAIAASTQ